MTKKKKELSQTQFIAIGFLLMIVIGALLLMLPISSRDGSFTDPLSALFTATSASCVTGLVVFDTYQHWSLFGQTVILILIQIGGLGFMTIGLLFAMLLRKNIGLRARNIMQESISVVRMDGIVKLVKLILAGTVIFEGTGAIILSIRFIPKMGLFTGIYYGVFHSISAFCNAGFDLMGKYEEYSSFTGYVGDPVVNLVFVFLILSGGLGFIVWQDLYHKKLNFRKYELQTKLVLVGTLIFTIGGTILFLIFENSNLFSEMSVMDKIWASLFSAVTPRTAGFNTVDTASLSPASQLLTLFLMLVGGNPGSTAGGAKVTSIMVLFLFVWATLRQSSEVEIFDRRIPTDTVKKAAVVFTINLTLPCIASMFICCIQSFSLYDVLFETLSAMNTVGMTTGITRDLLPESKIAVMLLMYFGRIGSMTFAFSLFKKKNTDIIKSPVGNISVG